MIEKGIAQVSLSGGEDERFLAPGPQRSAASQRRRFLALLGLVFSIHAALLACFLYRDSSPDAVSKEEVAVEVVQEPPPPPPAKPPPPPPEPNPAPKPPEQEMEKPASSAPRAGTETLVDAKTTAATTEAPKADAPPRDGQPAPAEGKAPEQASAPKASEAAAKLEDDKSDAEPLDKAKVETRQPADPAFKAKVRTLEVKPEPARQLSALSALPAYHFAAASKMADFPAGTEDNRYLSVVFAKVMSKNHYRTSGAARRGARGVVSVSFVVDYMGRVPYQAVSESSGQPDLDAIAMAAVRSAAPYPPPPGSGSQQLIARLRFGP